MSARRGAAENEGREERQPPAADGGAGAPEPGIADRADYDPGYDPAAPVPCEVCGGVMAYTAACKLKCPRCGYARDCSDP